MTYTEWLACDNPIAMLDALPRKFSNRKLRLFAVACCHGIWHLISDERSRAAVDVTEQYANGMVGHERLVAARDEAREAKRQFTIANQVHARRAASAVQDATRDNARSAALNSAAESSRAMHVGDANHFDEDALRNQASLLRCIIGNPFLPAAGEPDWITASAVALARAIYQERTFGRLTELADALQDAGCSDAAFLAHCREPGEHARGCWVVDAVLGLA